MPGVWPIFVGVPPVTGTLAIGHIVRLDKQEQPYPYYEIALEFRGLDTRQGRFEYSATMTGAGPSPGLIRQAKQLNPTFTRKRAPRMDILVREVQRGQGVLQWDARRSRIPKGLRMRWVVDNLRPVSN